KAISESSGTLVVPLRCPPSQSGERRARKDTFAFPSFALGGLATVWTWQGAINKRQDFSNQSGEQSMEPRQQLGLPGNDQLGCAADCGIHDLPCCAMRGDCGNWCSGSHAEPAKLRFVVAFKIGVQVRASPHQARNDGCYYDAFASDLST